MVESGASVKDVSKAMAHYKMLAALGIPPSKIAEQILQELRSGDDISKEKLISILKAGGIDEETAVKVLLIQKKLASGNADPEVMVKAMMLEKALLDSGADPDLVLALLNAMCDEIDDFENFASDLRSGSLEYDDIVKAIQFYKTINGGNQKSNLDDLIKDFVAGKVKGEKALRKLAKDILAQCDVSPEVMAQMIALQKVISSMNVSSHDISKLISAQKHMYDLGATPQDIAQVFQTLLKDGFLHNLHWI